MYTLWLVTHRLAKHSFLLTKLFLSNFKIVLSFSPSPTDLPTVRLKLTYSLHPYISLTIPIKVGTVITIAVWLYRLVSHLF